MCIICSKAENIGEEPPDHICPKNYEGSPKAMEADAALHLYKLLYYNSDKQLTLEAIVADDDSTMRALLRWFSIINKRGRLPTEIPEPEWLADPSHRTKVIAKPIFNLANASKKISSCTKIDAIRFKKYVGYMLKRNRNRSISEISKASKAVIEHLFNCHDFCNIDWCRPLKNMKEGKKEEGSQSFYRNKVHDKKLYDQMWDCYRPFTTITRLKESLHEFDTQKNEAMNTSIAKYAPKTKTYGMTISLTNRVMIAVGTNNLGHEKYWTSVYSSMDLKIGTETISFLKSLDHNRVYKGKYQKQKEVKVRRSQSNNDKIKEQMEQQKKDYNKGMTYGAGVALSMDTYPDFIREKETQKKELLNVQCPWFGCFTKGHVSTKAKKCQYHGYYKNDQELQQKIHAYLKPIYPSHYGECYKYSCRPTVPSDSKIRQPKFPLRQSTFAFYEHHFEEK